MVFTEPPPKRYRAILRKMKKGSDHLFVGAKGSTVWPIVYRMKKETGHSYVTQTETKGIRVWRMK